MKHHSPFEISSQRRSDAKAVVSEMKSLHQTGLHDTCFDFLWSQLIIHPHYMSPHDLKQTHFCRKLHCNQVSTSSRRRNIVPGSMVLFSTSIDKSVLKHKILWPAIMMVDTELQWFAFYSWCFRNQFGGLVITNDDLVLATLTTSQRTKFRRGRYTYSCVPCLLSLLVFVLAWAYIQA